MKKWLRSFVSVLFVPLVAGPASATILAGSVSGGTAQTAGGTFVKLGIPLGNPFGPSNSVGNDTFQNPNLYGFDEDQNIVLAAPLAVDVGTGPLPIGTTVASHYVFFDPGPTQTMVGRVTFDAPVLAILTSTDRLAASDFLANTGVNYLNPGMRGLEVGDSVTISGTNEILFATSASSPGDYVRVLTAFSPAAAVPEPASVVQMGLGIALLLALGKTRRNAR
jgi:hypothetical protein